MLRSIVRASMVEDVFRKYVCIRGIRTGGDRQPDGDRWRSPDILGRQRDQQLVTAFPDWGIDDAIHLFTGVEAQHALTEPTPAKSPRSRVTRTSSSAHTAHCTASPGSTVNERTRTPSRDSLLRTSSVMTA
jgi:hypothetical protein